MLPRMTRALSLFSALALGFSPAVRAPAQEAKPASVLDRVPAGYTNLLVVRDLVPSAEAFLASEPYRNVVRDRQVRALLREAGADPGQLDAGLRLIAPMVPSEIVVAAPPESAAAAADVLFGLSRYLLETGGTSDSDGDPGVLQGGRRACRARGVGPASVRPGPGA